VSVTNHETVKVACAQVAPVVADPDANRRMAARVIRSALAAGANMIVLPELMSTGYHLDAAEASMLAEPVDGPTLRSWRDALQGSDAVVIGGFCEAGNNGVVHNSAALVDAAGVVATYRKTHLWADEHLLFEPGDQPPPVVETRWGSVGIAICYDLFFPELTRTLALGGAQLLAIPTNSPWGGPRVAADPAAHDGIGHAVARSAAYLNRVFVAVADRHGDERGASWTARSSIIGPEGDFLAGPVGYDEGLLLADCRLADADVKQWEGTTNDAFRDRRPELYDAVIR